MFFGKSCTHSKGWSQIALSLVFSFYYRVILERMKIVVSPNSWPNQIFSCTGETNKLTNRKKCMFEGRRSKNKNFRDFIFLKRRPFRCYSIIFTSVNLKLVLRIECNWYAINKWFYISFSLKTIMLIWLFVFQASQKNLDVHAHSETPSIEQEGKAGKLPFANYSTFRRSWKQTFFVFDIFLLFEKIDAGYVISFHNWV